MRSLGWAPNPEHDCYSIRREKGYRYVKKVHSVAFQGEDGHLQTKDKASEETNPAYTLIFGN